MRPNGIPIASIRWAAFALTAMLCGGTGAELPGPVTLVQADPHHRGTLVAGTANAQLFRSGDAGDTWTAIPFPGALRSTLHAVLIDPTTADVYWAAVSSETPQYAGLFRTLDAGATWQPLRGMEGKQVWALASWGLDARVVAAGAQDGVFLTRDSGETWTRLSSPGSPWPQPAVSLAFDPIDRNTLYAGTPHLAWKTTDSGVTWHRIPKGMHEDSDIFSIDVDPGNRKRLFAGACSGIYSSVDGGGTWLNLEGAVGAQLRTYVIARAPFPRNSIFAGTSGGLFQSPDGGAKWRRLSVGTVRSIAFDAADPRLIFVATDQGLLRSEDGGIHFHGANRGIAEQGIANQGIANQGIAKR
jgi:photosystem II stability/assembly factor-like uncharacterized protein